MTAKGFNNHSDSFSYSHIQIGNYISNPLTSWNVIEERKGKIGWITELNSEFKHKYIDLKSLYEEDLINARAYEKFKVIAVKICPASSN
eukprot:gene18422-24126_t